LARLRANVVGSLPEQIGELRRALDAGPVTLDDLPAELRDGMIAADGRARVQVWAKADLGDSEALESFVDAVRSQATQVTGSAVSLVEWGRVTSNAMKQALTTGVVCMLVFLFVLWRSVRDTLLAFFPLALAAGVTVAFMVLGGEQFNFANVIVLPMLIGMGVDNGIHLVHRHRSEPEEEDVLGTSTARAVFFSTVTTILSFGSLAFAPHLGMAAIGKILTLGVAATFVCYVVVLPAVLEWDDRRNPGARKHTSPRD
jgi:predicted RND superfamily exporter protein